MKKPKVFYPSVGILLAIGFVLNIAGFIPDALGQKTAERGRLVRPTVSRASTTSNSRFAAAVSENSRVRTGLAWTFSGKAQKGWNIYATLIGHTVGDESGPETTEFAEAVSRWQSNAGLPATGVIDRNTLDSFVKHWQSKRLFKRGYPSANQMLMGPTSDFYDPTREDELRQLESQTYAAFKRMVAAAEKETGSKLFTYGNGNRDERFLRIVSGYRSQAYQESLRKREPNSGPAGLARVSAHSTGRAIDIYLGGEPVATRDDNRMIQVQTPAYKWLVKNAERFGFVPYFYEPWHWEYVGTN